MSNRGPRARFRWPILQAPVSNPKISEEKHMATMSSAEQNISALAEGDAPVLETLAQMTLDTFERSGLDAQTYTLVRLAALASMDAAPVSYLLNLGAAEEIGVPIEMVQGVLVAIAPVVGSARVVSAAGKMIRGIGLVAEPSE
jgi:4-carboxymuconolactone decarboxylase